MLHRFDLFSQILREADGSVGGLVAAAGAADLAAAKPAADAGQSGAGAARRAAAAAADATKPADVAAQIAQPYVPDGLPETFKGTSERETIDKLWGHFKANQPPPKPEDYKVTIPQDLAGVIDPTTDPVLPIYRSVAQKHGLTQTQFDGVMADLFGEMSKAGMMERPIDVAAEFAALSDGQGDRSAQVAAGKRVAQELGNSIAALSTRGVISKDAAAELSGPMLANAKQFKAMGELVAALTKSAGGLTPGGLSTAGEPGDGEQATLRKFYPSMSQPS